VFIKARYGSQLAFKFHFIFNFVYFIVFLAMESIPIIILNLVIALDYGSLVATYISIFYAALYILLSFESRLNTSKKKHEPCLCFRNKSE